MTLIYYDNQTPKDKLQYLAEGLRRSFDDDVLFLPKSFEAYLNATKEQLLEAKNTIEEALLRKETE